MGNFSYSSELVQALSAPLVEQVKKSDTSSIIYMGFPDHGDLSKCAIKRVEYSKNGDTESWITTWANGMKEQVNDWAQRASLDYSLSI